MRSALSVSSNHSVNDGIDSPTRSDKRGEPGRSHVHQPLRRRQHHQKIVETHDAVDGAGKLIRFLAQVSVEQSLSDHVEREMHHVDGNVALLTRLPTVT